ncbi:hypothetical protein Syun_017842 [Stephania yunnanensis]|uniref:Uncharacterized protein n=1 Tax=Stephania yunnanensis TaxID=152371 RepID=A0AAP0J9E4_9MAGN
MKLYSLQFFSLVHISLLLFIGDMERTVVMVEGENSIHPPEHTCQKTAESSKCDPLKCMEDCSMETKGVGHCRGLICTCTFYCKHPP